MSPADKALLTTAFEALGPERVTRGPKAAGHRWRDCLLAPAMRGGVEGGGDGENHCASIGSNEQR